MTGYSEDVSCKNNNQKDFKILHFMKMNDLFIFFVLFIVFTFK